MANLHLVHTHGTPFHTNLMTQQDAGPSLDALSADIGSCGPRSVSHMPHSFFVLRLVTVHNHPDRLAVMPGVRHLKIELADVEGADISPHFNSVYEFIADAERLKQRESSFVHDLCCAV